MDSIRYKELLVKSLFEQGIYCYPSNGKKGLKGWNDFEDREQYLERALRLLKKYPDCNLAINLKPSNLICVDIDDPGKFSKIYSIENFNTFSCKTPRGYHFYFLNDINLAGNFNLEKFGVEVHTNHLSNFYGEGYQLEQKEIRKASEYKSFFDFILDISNSQSQNPKSQNKDNSLLRENFNTEPNKEYLHTESNKGKKKNISFCIKNTLEEKIFEKIHELEKEYDFVNFAFEFVFGVEAKKSMLCVLHDEKNPSASVFRANSGYWRYRCFHDGETYSILNLVLRYFNISGDKEKVFAHVFAYYLVRVYLSNQREKEIKIMRLLRSKSEKLANVYLLIASLNSSPEEHFLSVRDLSWILQLNDITKANRLLNFLCLVGVLEKFRRGYGKAYGYKVKEDIDLRELEREIERLKGVDIYKLSKENALKYFDKEKVEKIYLRENNKKAKKKELVGAGAGVGHQTKKNMSIEEIREFFNGKYLS
jgi:hypothetical protein